MFFFFFFKGSSGIHLFFVQFFFFLLQIGALAKSSRREAQTSAMISGFHLVCDKGSPEKEKKTETAIFKGPLRFRFGT